MHTCTAQYYGTKLKWHMAFIITTALRHVFTASLGRDTAHATYSTCSINLEWFIVVNSYIIIINQNCCVVPFTTGRIFKSNYEEFLKYWHDYNTLCMCTDVQCILDMCKRVECLKCVGHGIRCLWSLLEYMPPSKVKIMTLNILVKLSC
jgi:hypothetical protein